MLKLELSTPKYRCPGLYNLIYILFKFIKLEKGMGIPITKGFVHVNYFIVPKSYFLKKISTIHVILNYLLKHFNVCFLSMHSKRDLL